jgi:hypothetical protein
MWEQDEIDRLNSVIEGLEVENEKLSGRLDYYNHLCELFDFIKNDQEVKILVSYLWDHRWAVQGAELCWCDTLKESTHSLVCQQLRRYFTFNPLRSIL